MKKNYQDSLIMTSGTVINALLGLGFYVLLARALNPSSLGEFSFFLGVGVLAAELGDWGSSNALIKFGQNSKFGQFLLFVVAHRILISVVLLSLGIIGTRWWGQELLVSSLIAISLLMVSFMNYLFLGQKKIWAAALINLGGNSVRLAVAFFFLSGNSVFGHWLLLLIGGNLFSLALGIVLVPLILPHITFRLPLEQKTFKEMVGFSFWLGASFSLASLAAKMDIPLLYALGGSAMTGIYSLAQKFTSFLPQIVAALEGVFASKMSEGETNQPHFKDYFVISLVFSVLLVGLMPLYPQVTGLLFGHKYDAMTPVLLIMVFGFALFSLAGPFTAKVVYEFGQSKYHLVGSTICLLTGLTLYVILIPRYGAIGAAVSFVAIQLVNLVFYIYQAKTYGQRNFVRS